MIYTCKEQPTPAVTAEAYMENIGPRIRLARRLVGLTQAALGERLGVTGQAVGNWERGGLIDSDNLEKLRTEIPLDDPRIEQLTRSAEPGRQAASKLTIGAPTEARALLAAYGRTPTPRPPFAEDRDYEAEFRDAMDAYLPGYGHGRELRAGEYTMRFDFVSDYTIADIVVARPSRLHQRTQEVTVPRFVLSPMAVYGAIVRLAVAQRTASPPRDAVLILVVPNDTRAATPRFRRTVWEASVIGVETHIVDSVTAAAELLAKKEIDAMFPDEDDTPPPET